MRQTKTPRAYWRAACQPVRLARRRTFSHPTLDLTPAIFTAIAHPRSTATAEYSVGSRLAFASRCLVVPAA
jgi:hypothetical protein